ncbi:MAG: LON peptidase substrate-binding domain-containing protein [Myxococcota bacterium]|nr:LON peptidase substrate-binding domain-containing protein [Myxococcota bacterium]
MSEQARDTIPIFPLGNVVLFPGTHVPLHIFEPRYREMTRAAIQSDRRIGMIAVRPERRSEMPEDPDLFPIGCEGIISRAEEEPDGTWNLILTATHRFKIIAEPPRPAERGYRTAQIEYLEETETDQPLTELRAGICTRLEEMLRRMTPAGEVQPTLDKLSELDDGTLVCSLAQGLDFGVLEKQRLLEAAGLKTRATILSDLLQFRIAEIETLSSPGTDQIQ